MQSKPEIRSDRLPCTSNRQRAIITPMRGAPRSRTNRTRLNDELLAVLGRGLDKVDGAPGYKRMTNIDELEALGNRFTKDRTGLKRSQRIECLLRSGVEKLGTSNDGRRCWLLFGFDSQWRESATKTRRAAYEELGEQQLSKTSRVTNDRNALESLETAILELTQELDVPKIPSRMVGAVSSRLTGLPPYISRTTYHETFLNLVEQGSRLIAIVGDRGNGKSRLALELIRPRAGVSVFLDASNVTRDLVATVAARGARLRVESDELQLPVLFAELVSSSGAPEFVILDNVDDPSLVEWLVPTDMRSIVIVTANVRIARCESTTILVDAMGDNEAEQLARAVLGEANADLAERLLRHLGGRPLGIVHVCRLVKRSLVDPDELVMSLRTDIADLFEGVLTDLYELTLARLSRVDVVARRALSMIAFLRHEAIPLWLLRESLGEGTSTAMFARAISRLTDLYLISLVDNKVSIHPLTQSLLAEILSEERSSVCRQLLAPMQSKFASIRVDEPFSLEDLEWLAHALSILPSLRPDDVGGLGKVLQVVVRSGRQNGQCPSLYRLSESWDIFELVMSSGPLSEAATREAALDWLEFMYDEQSLSPVEYYECLLRLLGVDDASQAANIGVRGYLLLQNAVAVARPHDESLRTALRKYGNTLWSAESTTNLQRAKMSLSEGRRLYRRGWFRELDAPLILSQIFAHPMMGKAPVGARNPWHFRFELMPHLICLS